MGLFHWGREDFLKFTITLDQKEVRGQHNSICDCFENENHVGYKVF